jgi:transposase
MFLTEIKKNKKQQLKKTHMRPLTLVQRTDIATRLNAGQTPKSIADTLNVGVKNIYRLKKQFLGPNGKYLAVAASQATKERFTRDQLKELAQWLEEAPKTTLEELRTQTVTEGVVK